MLCYDRIDSEGIDVNKNSARKECDISLYWYFLKKVFYVSAACPQWVSWCIKGVY